jgi:hypothetical protein
MKKILFASLFAILLSACDPTTSPPDHKLSATDYVGTWYVQEDCSKNTYSVTITVNTDDSTVVYISNFGQLGNDFQAEALIDEELISILKQSVDGTEVQGNGTLSDNKITWSFSINDGTDLTECTATYSR